MGARSSSGIDPIAHAPVASKTPVSAKIRYLFGFKWHVPGDRGAVNITVVVPRWNPYTVVSFLGLLCAAGHAAEKAWDVEKAPSVKAPFQSFSVSSVTLCTL